MHLDNHLQEVLKVISQFPYNQYEEIKKKKQDELAYKVSEKIYHSKPLTLRGLIWDLHCTYHIACNDVCVNEIVTLAAKIEKELKPVIDTYNSGDVKSCQHSLKYMKEHMNLIKAKDRLSYLLDDLEGLGQKFEFTIDKKDVVQKFKDVYDNHKI